MCPLKLWAQWTQKAVLSLVDRFLKEGVSTGVAKAVRLQGLKVQPVREENRAILQHTVLYGPCVVQKAHSSIPMVPCQGASRSGEELGSWETGGLSSRRHQRPMQKLNMAVSQRGPPVI